MPSDNVEDDELGPVPGRDRDKKRRDADGSNWRKNAGASRDPSARQENANLPPPLPTGTSHQIELLLAKRQHRVRNLFFRVGLIVLLPTFIVWFYTALIATPRYVCNFEITYQAYQPSSTLAAGLIPSDQGTSVTENVDYGALIYEYIRSETLAQKVDQQINVREHFSSRKIDSLARLSPSATQADFLAYWRDHVAVSEGFGGYLTVQVQGFDPAFTLLLSQTIAKDADDMIDGLNVSVWNSEIDSAAAQVKIAATELKKSNDALTAFRNSHGDLDPGFAATQLATIVGQLEGQLAILRAQLQQAEANMQPNNSQVVQLKLQVGALEQQIASERLRLSDNASTSYSDTVSQYNDLLSDQQFASTNYQSAQQGLILARANAVSQQNYAVDFVAPVLPDHPTLPDPFVSSLTTFLIFIAVYGIGNLLLAAFRDQTGV